MFIFLEFLMSYKKAYKFLASLLNGSKVYPSVLIPKYPAPLQGYSCFIDNHKTIFPDF